MARSGRSQLYLTTTGGSVLRTGAKAGGYVSFLLWPQPPVSSPALPGFQGANCCLATQRSGVACWAEKVRCLSCYV